MLSSTAFFFSSSVPLMVTVAVPSTSASMLGCCPDVPSGEVVLEGWPDELVRESRFAGNLGRALAADEIGASGLFNFAASSSRVGGLLEGILFGLLAGSVDAIVVNEMSSIDAER